MLPNHDRRGRPDRHVPRALTSAVLCTLVLAVFLSPLLPFPAPRAHAAATEPLMEPLLIELDVTYDPETCVLSVTYNLEFEVTREGTYSLGLPDTFKIDSAELDGVKAIVTHLSNYNVYFMRVSPLPGESEVGEVKRWTITYHGTPENYDTEQDRYWTGATGEALWVTSQFDWLPAETGLIFPNDYWVRPDYRVSVSLPDGWRALTFSPPVAEEVSGGRATYRFESISSNRPLIVILAGPYRSCGQAAVGNVSYEVWGLDKWWEAAEDLFAEMGSMLDYGTEVIGPHPSSPDRLLTVVQVPPEQGGGTAWPSQGFMIVAAEGQRYRPMSSAT